MKALLLLWADHWDEMSDEWRKIGRRNVGRLHSCEAEARRCERRAAGLRLRACLPWWLK